MVKKIRIAIFATLVSLMLVFIPAKVNAASEVGSGTENPVNVAFDKEYSKTWDSSYYTQKPYYNKINVTKKGILKMTFSKFGYKNNNYTYAPMKIVVSDKNDKVVWDTSSSKQADDKNSTEFVYYVGLNAGTYYVKFNPAYSVGDTNVTTKYKFTFTADNNIEVEPNEKKENATVLSLNKMYRGFFGYDYGTVGEYDFYKVKLTKNKNYRIFIDNKNIFETTILIDLYDANGKYTSTTFRFKENNNGMNVYEFTAGTTGDYYIKIWNYHGAQMEYKIGVYDSSAKAPTSSVNGTTNNKSTDKIVFSDNYIKAGKSITIMQDAGGKSVASINLAANTVKEAIEKKFTGTKVSSSLKDNVGTGTVVNLANGQKVTVIYKGDVNGDGKVSIADAGKMVRASFGKVKLTEAQKKAGDIGGSKDQVNSADAGVVVRLLFGGSNSTKAFSKMSEFMPKQ